MGSAEGHFTLNDSFFFFPPCAFVPTAFCLTSFAKRLFFHLYAPSLYNGTGDYENWLRFLSNNINLGGSREVLAGVVTARLRWRSVMAAESRGVTVEERVWGVRWTR